MKKICLIIASILIFSLLSSCGSEMSLMDFLPSNDSLKGFGGYEFVIKGNWPYSWDPNARDTSDQGGVALSISADAHLAHNAKIMEEYDCKITSVLEDDWRWAQDMMVDVMANTVDYDLADTNAQFMVDNIKSGYIVPWNKTTLDITDYDKYGPEGYLKGSAYGDDYYGIWPLYWGSVIGYKGVMGVNNIQVKEFCGTSVKELYENGKWTYDEFKSLLQLCSADEEILPLTYYDKKVFMMSALLSNGANIVKYDESIDKYEYGLTDLNSITALEYVKSLVDEGLAYSDVDYGHNFEEHFSPFYITESWTIGGNIEDMDIICFPFGPNGEYGSDFSSYRSVNDRYLYLMASDYNDEVVRFVDIWFEEFAGYSKADILKDFRTNNFYNDHSYEMFLNLAKVSSFDYSFAIYDVYDDHIDALSKAVFEGKAIAGTIESYTERLQASIDRNLNK